MSTLRWGVASTGNIAGSMVTALHSIADEHDLAVVAVGSRTQAAADEFASAHHIPRAHGSYDALWGDPDVDVIYIASPHSHHHEMTIAALEAGKHVLCEKAFAVDAAQARGMIATARRAERFLMEAMWSWMMPAWQDIRRRIAADEIGEIVTINANFGIRVLDPDGRHRRADLAGGALLDLGIYPLALTRFLLGEPNEVCALGLRTDGGVDATLGAVLRYDRAIAVMNTSIDSTSDLRASIVGTGGRIDIHAPFWYPSAFTIHRGDPRDPSAQSTRERVEMPNRGLAHEAEHVAARIRAGAVESDLVTWESTIAGMELMDEIRRQVGVVYPDPSSR